MAISRGPGDTHGTANERDNTPAIESVRRPLQAAKREGPRRALHGHEGSAVTLDILLIRHGESVWNAEGRIQGQADPPLSQLGARQAEALGRRLAARSLTGLYCSPATRAYDTALAIGEPHGMEPQRQPDLLEIDLGTWQGQRISDLHGDSLTGYRDWERDPASWQPPHGETIADVYARVAPICDRILSTHLQGTVAVITHSIAGRVALCHLLGSSLDLVPRLRLKKASLAIVRVNQDTAVLERLGDTKHLRAPA